MNKVHKINKRQYLALLSSKKLQKTSKICTEIHSFEKRACFRRHFVFQMIIGSVRVLTTRNGSESILFCLTAS